MSNKRTMLTVNDILAPAEVKDLLDRVNHDRARIEALVCIWKTKDGQLCWDTNLDLAELILILRKIENKLIEEA